MPQHRLLSQRQSKSIHCCPVSSKVECTVNLSIWESSLRWKRVNQMSRTTYTTEKKKSDIFAKCSTVPTRCCFALFLLQRHCNCTKFQAQIQSNQQTSCFFFKIKSNLESVCNHEHIFRKTIHLKNDASKDNIKC